MWDFIFEKIIKPIWNSKFKWIAIILLIVFVIYFAYTKLFERSIIGDFKGLISSQNDTIKIVAIFQTNINEPWDGAIHTAITKTIRNYPNPIHYEVKDGITAPDKRAEFAQKYSKEGYDLIICDSYGAEEELRLVAKENNNTNFLLGSGLGPTEPNVAVFDNWIHESAYLAGMLAGAITDSNKIGIIAGIPVAEVNRLVNAFVLGAKKINPKIHPYIEYIDEWYNPNKASNATERLINEGVDVFYAERAGVIEICKQFNIPVFGNIINQSNESYVVVSSVVWNMEPTIKHVLSLIEKKEYCAEDFGDWSMMYKSGNSLIPFEISDRWKQKCNTNEMKTIKRLKNDIKYGVERVPIVEIDMRPYFK